MKKFLALVLAVLMCFGCLTACGKKKETTNADAASLADAVSYLHQLYKDGAKETPVDYDVVGKLTINGVVFSVTWATNNANITVKESTKAGFYTIDVPDKTDVEIPYVITATVKDAAGKTQSKSYERVVPIIDNTALVTAPEAGVAYKFYLVHATLGKTLYATQELQNDKYIITTTDAAAGADFYAEAVEGGYKIYTMIDGAKKYITGSVKEVEEGKFSKYLNYSDEGSVWYYNATVNAWLTMINGGEYVVGTYGTFETMSISESSYITAENTGKTQFPAGFITSENAAELPEYVAPEAPTTLTPIKDILAIKEGEQPVGEVLVEGVVSSIKNTTYGNMYIQDAAGNELYIYGMYDSTGAVRFDAMTNKPAVGDTIKVQSMISFYNGTVQLLNAKLLKITKGEGGEVTPPAEAEWLTGTSDVKENTKYKLFVNQKTANMVLYAIGETDSDKFIKTTLTGTTAPDFYVEKVTGGYKFYTTINGAKKYIVGKTETKDDGKVSKFVYFGDAGSVFYYKSDVKAWFVKINDVEYVFGTYGDYKTLSLSEASYITAENTGVSQFPVSFLEADKATDTEVDTTPKDATIKEVLAMTTAPTYEVIVEGVIKNVTNTQYGNMYIVDAEGNELLLYGFYDGSTRYDAMTTKPVAGDTVKVQGPVSFFNNVPQIKNAQMKAHTPATPDTGDGEGDGDDTPAAPADKTIAEILAIGATLAHQESTDYEVVVEGIITNIYNTTYGNMYIKDADGNELCLYGFYDGDTRFDSMTIKPVVGDTVKVQGAINKYNSTVQIKNAKMVSISYGPKEKTIVEILAMTTAPDYEVIVEGVIKNIYNTTYGNMYIQDAAGNELCLYGLYDGNTRFDAMTTQPAVGDTVKVQGAVSFYNNAPQLKNAQLKSLTPATPDTGDGEGDGDGDDSNATSVVFEFGAKINSTTHSDNNTDIGSAGKSYTVDGYTLKLTNCSKAYVGGNDAKGNIMLKLGTGSAIGTVTFTVPDDVTSVVIMAAKYKAKDSQLVINNTNYTLSKSSDNGEYEAITIDTTTTKTITIKTASTSKARACIDSITYVIG